MKVKKTEKIPISKVEVPQVRSTAIFDTEEYLAFSQSVRAIGIVQPIVVRKVKDKYELVDGLHRLTEAKEKGEEQIDAVIVELSDEDAMLYNIILNRLRGKHDVFQEAKVYRYLVDEKNMKVTEIAKRVGVDTSRISQILKLAEAPVSVKKAVEDKRISIDAALTLTRHKDEIDVDVIVADTYKRPYTTEDVEDTISKALEIKEQRVEAPPPRVEHRVEEPRLIACPACGNSYPEPQVRGIPLCDNCRGFLGEIYTVIATAEFETTERFMDWLRKKLVAEGRL